MAYKGFRMIVSKRIGAIALLLGVATGVSAQAAFALSGQHTALGYMYDACLRESWCSPTALSIDASTSPEDGTGTAVYQRNGAGVDITLDCVKVKEGERTPLDHRLFASGHGSDGKIYYIVILDPAAGLAGYFVTLEPNDAWWAVSECNARYPDYWPGGPERFMGTVGDFEILP